jgi:hypothetical protein
MVICASDAEECDAKQRCFKCNGRGGMDGKTCTIGGKERATSAVAAMRSRSSDAPILRTVDTWVQAR